MCRLFGLTAGTARVRATFWLLDAPDSIEVQSRRNADGSGIGFFDAAGSPVLDKQPEPAFSDEEFIHEARQAESATFVAHVRLATSGGRTLANTHPFAMDGRIMAHNGGFGELRRIDAQLGRYRRLVLGDTDSERYFLWALRYPGTRALHVLERPGRPAGGLHVRNSMSSVHAPDAPPCVVVASERLDGETGWRMLAPGELVHIGPDLRVRSAVVVAGPPARTLGLRGENPNVDT